MKARVPILGGRLLAAVLLAGVAACGGGATGPRHGAVAAAPAAEGTALATFVLVGDTIAHGMDPDLDLLGGVAALLAGADVFVLNQEGVLLAAPLPPGCAARPQQSLLFADPRSADAYAVAPRVVATLGNNHALDCDAFGLCATRAALEARGYATVGAASDAAGACGPLRLAIGGLDVAFLAYLAMPADDLAAGPASAGAARWDTCRGADAVAALDAAGAFVVVSLHLHLAQGWTATTAAPHRALVEEVLAAGADLVVAHGPHVPQGMLVRGGGIGFLSLGNFLFAQDEALPSAARDVLVARVAVHAAQVRVEVAAARLDPQGRPETASSIDASRILDGFRQRSQGEGAPVVRHGERAYLLADR